MGAADMSGARRHRQGRARHEEVEIDSRVLTLTNLDKVLWPEEGLTKADLIDYYRRMAPIMLPYLRDRPQVLHRTPGGIEGIGFFQKHAGPRPEWIQVARIGSQSDGRTIDYILCQDEATLVYLANLGCIEMNPWNSRFGSLDSPDYVVIDLDPVEVSFNQVITIALAVRDVLEEAGVASYVKTSGGSGLHVFVPLAAGHGHEEARDFAHLVGQAVAVRLPGMTSLERNPAHRRGRVYLDYLQNRWGQPSVAAYSLRPRPGAPVSTPLHWEEMRTGLSPAAHTMTNITDRLDRVGDLWRDTLEPGTDLAAISESLRAMIPP
jgi:bifunctional non-homologous end joining protein LigD